MKIIGPEGEEVKVSLGFRGENPLIATSVIIRVNEILRRKGCLHKSFVAHSVISPGIKEVVTKKLIEAGWESISFSHGDDNDCTYLTLS